MIYNRFSFYDDITLLHTYTFGASFYTRSVAGEKKLLLPYLNPLPEHLTEKG